MPKKSPASKNTSWRAGYAQGDITPPIHRPMTGFGRERYATGVIAPLRAQALALQDAAGKTAVILAADVIEFETITLEFIRRALAKSHGIDPTAVMLAPSHTHWGPGFHYGISFYVSPVNWYFLRFLEDKLVALAEAALKDLAAAKVGYTAATAQIGHNRRTILPDGSVGWGANLTGHYDRHTPVLRVTRRVAPERGNDILLVSHACHTTSTGSDNKWSPDYAGGMRDHIERTLGPGARAIFAMGCGGDAKVTHVDPKSKQVVFSASPAQSRAGGKRLATAVLDHLRDHPAEPLAARLAWSRKAAEFQLARPRSRAILESWLYDPKTNAHDASWARQQLSFPKRRNVHAYDAVAWVLGGRLTLFGLPDEVCSPVGPRTREQAKTDHAMIIAYANTVGCYIPTSQIVHEGGYEGESSHRSYSLPAPFTTAIDEEFVALINRLVKSLG